ncbi:MAG TPA: Clp protease N-terminal domain-containing protein [Gemmatimonadaceae bacterium]|nr:Clp protease N-terminal domain-containing protein [Gemmatimonadaceae bacterium]
MSGYDFTTRVRGALNRARDEATRHKHQYIGTEHLILGLLGEEDTLVSDTLDKLGVTSLALRSEVEDRIPAPSPETLRRSSIDLPYTPRARVVLEQAMAAARELNDGYVGTQHLLLGLIRENHGIAAQALAALGITEHAIKSEMQRILEGGAAVAEVAKKAISTSDTQIPLRIEVEVRYEDGTLAKRVFASKDEAIGFLSDKAND